ncbi:coiled-coil domain-containing protein, partial [Cupriavidus alkaliphilus]|uniref:KfrA protein n=1 Tax=Cupriavidus alkaliphilus TaxID=942866 RepID=UPI0038B3979F
PAGRPPSARPPPPPPPAAGAPRPPGARAPARAGGADRAGAHAETALAREEAVALVAQLDTARQAIEAGDTALAAERQAHAATRARLEAGRAELEAGRRQLEELRTQFSTELERAREQVVIAQERAEASERRALRELDTERTARQKSERAAEELRGELVAARHEAHDAAVAHAEARARLETQAAALTEQFTTRLAAADAAERKTADDLGAVQAELAAAQRRAERAEAEAALVRQLLAKLRLGPRERDGAERRRRQAGGSATSASDTPREPPAEDHKLSAPSEEDGSDSSDNQRDDSKH